MGLFGLGKKRKKRKKKGYNTMGHISRAGRKQLKKEGYKVKRKKGSDWLFKI